ncbi:hypothetical protein TRFO_30337 [Tritrichomonas foetus]|uniref:CCZ1/INTU/HSP4 first Longin domain-containing protein n=1 Tax=Tritrichomonas foetus TaxID=1144522 RepID=A0A1J4JTZ7_9EUKA|nr:hypothetical protein TRFO_30337 [Tritrichomonas foetus]|eukprot:OHT02507.1 hypothetical protein TRFO_30337 [Tritrichomonas foetus]
MVYRQISIPLKKLNKNNVKVMQSDFFSFFVYESKITDIEMSEPILYFSYTKSEQNEHFAINQAGLFITFVGFCKIFNHSQPCDYIQTKNHETALLELGDNIWMSITREYSKTPQYQFLHTILLCYKRIFQLFFPMPTRDPKTGDVFPESRDLMKHAFELITKSIYNPNMMMPILYDSILRIDLPSNIYSTELEKTVTALLHINTSPIEYLAVMYSDYFIFTNYPIDVSRTIYLCFRSQFEHFQFNSPTKDQNEFYYEIGLVKNKKGETEVHSPSIYIKGQKNHLVVLRHGCFRYAIALKASIEPEASLLDALPSFIRPIRVFITALQIEIKKNKPKCPYFQITSNKNYRSLGMTSQKIPTQLMPNIHNLIITATIFARSYSKSVYLALPIANRFFIWCKSDSVADSAVVIKSESKKISKLIEACKYFNDPVHVTRFNINSRNEILRLPFIPL